MAQYTDSDLDCPVPQEKTHVEDAPELLSAELEPQEFDWISRLCEPITLPQGHVLVAEGDLADHFYILIDGDLRATPRELEPCMFSRRPGDPPLLIGAVFMRCLEAASPSRLLRIGADGYLQHAASQSPASHVIIRSLIWRFRTTEAILHQSEKLASLGKLAAGLAHELNNPAAAARRAASQLSAELSRLYGIASRLGEDLDAPHLRRLLQTLAVYRAAGTRMGDDPLRRADVEEAVGAWLVERQVDDAWDLAPRLVAAGMTPTELSAFTDGLAPGSVGDALRWVGGIMSVEVLIETLDVCNQQISDLVNAVKSYAYMDRAPSQEVNVIDGIENTLIILRHRLSRIRLHREYQADLPRIWAHGSELNQVWTNLLANAVDALEGEGNIWIRAGVEGENLAVEIADDGPGIPEAVQSRIFEPFFTTKDTQHSAGLGLDIVYSIVVRRHSGAVQLNSKPGDTTFRVLLPLKPAMVEDDVLRPINVEKAVP